MITVNPRRLDAIRGAARTAAGSAHAALDAEFSAITDTLRNIRPGAHEQQRSIQAVVEEAPHPSDRPLTVLDINASDGSASALLLQGLSDAGFPCPQIYVAGRAPMLRRFRFGPISEYRDGNDGLVFLRAGPMGFRFPCPNHSLARAYLKYFPRKFLLKSGGELNLIHPCVDRSPQLHIMQFDFQLYYPDCENSFDVVRASNTLNCDSMAAKEIRSAIESLVQYLRPAGILVISRSVPGASGKYAEHGSVWRKVDDATLTPLADFGDGSEVQAVLAAPAA